jgi:CRISPR system Cascade subunit CasC
MADDFRVRWDDLVKGDKNAKAVAIDALGSALAESVHAPDIAMFGRMIEINTSTPFGKKDLGIDAACQVAHAVSTNRVATDFDFFTAVDDLLPQGDMGAGMMGTVEFNSACFYRYANVDMAQLTKNLGDAALAQATLEAFIRASVAAIPTGKQNSMAAQNPPSFVLAVVREAGLWSLANAFLKPISPDKPLRPDNGGNLVSNSQLALADYWNKLTTMYGQAGVLGAWRVSLDEAGLEQLAVADARNLDTLVAQVLDATARGAANGAAA